MQRYSFLKGLSSLSVLKQDSISSLDMLSSHLWFEIGLSSNQAQSQGLSWWCFYLWYFTVVHLHAFGLTNNFALFIPHVSSSSWNILISLLLSPLTTFLSSPCLRSSCWTINASVGNFWEPTMSHREACVLVVARIFLSFMCTCKNVAVNDPIYFANHCCFAPFVYTQSSNHLTHCVNSLANRGPQNFKSCL
jgi:hypothetical protein